MGSKREEEKKEKIIRGLMKLPPNRRCINCNSLVILYIYIYIYIPQSLFASVSFLIGTRSVSTKFRADILMMILIDMF